jgi:predicted O-methyltransferase YrrM
MITNYYSKYDPKILYRRFLNSLLLPIPKKEAQLSVISPVTKNTDSNHKLLSLALKASEIAINTQLPQISQAQVEWHRYIDIYPGEHYKLLYGLMQVLKPKLVIELGTYLGHASLVIKAGLQSGAILHTFDVIKWDDFRDTCLTQQDFSDGRLIQHLDDLTDYNNILKHENILRQADFIFVDALKDGKQELKFLENFKRIGLKSGCILMFDDIRVWNMIKIWDDINLPKLDITSLGHWSGTGLVDWQP